MGWSVFIRVTLYDKYNTVIDQQEIDIYKGCKTMEFFTMHKNCVRYSIKYYNEGDSDSESEFDVRHNNDPDSESEVED